MWIIHYEIAATVIILAVMLLYFAGNRIHTKESRIFTQIMIVSIIGTVLDIISVSGIDKTINLSVAGNYLACIAYSIAELAVIFLYANYMVSLTESNMLQITKGRILLIGPIILELLLILTTPFTKFVFYIDNDCNYYRGIAFNVFYLVIGLYLLYVAYMSIARSRYLNKLQFFAILFYSIFVVACGIVQVLMPDLLLNSFATAIGIIMIYISMQGDFIDCDKVLGTFSADAMNKKIGDSVAAGKSFYMINVRFGGFDKINTIYGFENANEVLRQIAEYLLKLIPNHYVFHANSFYFSCYVEGDYSAAFDYAVRIQERFLQRFRTDKLRNDVYVPFKIAVIAVPQFADSVDRINHISNMILSEPRLNDNQYIVVVNEEIIMQYERQCQIEKRIELAVRNGDFNVYYQPVVNLVTGKIDGAEALIRLGDEQSGIVSPEELIPIAEKNGSITQLTSMLVHRVCRFILDNKIGDIGVGYIGINLSHEECQQFGMAERLLSIIRGYDIPTSMIRFEIKEGIGSIEPCNLKKNIDILVENGVYLVMDRFGLGYSNAAELVDLPVEMIKIDKSLLWLAEESDGAMSALKALVEMMHCLNHSVLVGGVETEAHEEILRRLDIQFAQGYYYSKAVETKGFLEYARNVNEYGLSPVLE